MTSCFNYNVADQVMCPRVHNTGKYQPCVYNPGADQTAKYMCKNNAKPNNVCRKQSGGAFYTDQAGPVPQPISTAVDVAAMNPYDPVYNQCETVVQYPNNIWEGPVYGNLAENCNLRTNYLPSAQPNLKIGLVQEQKPFGPAKIETTLCNSRQRCGNGACQSPMNLGGCKKVELPKPCYWDNRVVKSPWVYGTADIPTYYLDLSGPIVAGTPQWRAGTNNSIPPMMLQNTVNLPGRQFGCRQPCWGPQCI